MIKTISYNLRKNSAAGEMVGIAQKYEADVLCLQEVSTLNLPERIGHLSLVHATAKNRLGLAMYVRADRFEVEDARTFQLKKSMHDRILAPTHERLLGAKLLDTKTDRSLVAASFHAAPLTALNSLRRHQIRAALDGLSALGPELPLLMVGDYNYPIFKERLRAEMERDGYNLSLSDKRTYSRYKMFRGHFDFATSAGFVIDRVNTLKRGLSDHLPILITASFDGSRVAPLSV